MVVTGIKVFILVVADGLDGLEIADTKALTIFL
jgi:hypothetical protein